ncbi:class I SAM-dependent methyltransferase [Amycolatopsis sp. FBCC-B4732]|uniref:class I SAM-dependent methyltransferase n=1 Tax=Amycolatopsis sp. FBCC-B4732 TaxID=3079339 RepID=UPI001FF6F9ED|nr:class I SAM-dependent methyltransferase [Amycolatopsis sp. FBCC-B4732]UOX86791.1 class I SAM-dependent methyltransferase [Amycolatopsis sp. FBCC-B4732]
MAGRGRLSPVGAPTRGTTNPNRLRRVDRWIASAPATTRLLRAAPDPLVVDLGYGASPVTTVELARWVRRVRPDVRVLGLELDPVRVAAALPAAAPPLLDFRRGGFELAGTRPALVRAFNVLRQYAEDEVAGAWELVLASMAPGGLLVEGTCDEIGRLSTWVLVSSAGPVSLTLSLRLAGLDRPSTIAERLPKALIHRNVPGERVHALLSALDTCWATAAPHQAFGVRSRWLEAVRLLAARGWPVLGPPSRIRLGELTVPWDSVAPA